MIGLLWMPLVGIRTGVAVKVGNYMGSNEPHQAKKMLVLGCIGSFIYYCTIPVTVFGVGRHQITYLLVNDDEVSRLVAKTSVFLLAVNIGNTLNVCLLMSSISTLNTQAKFSLPHKQLNIPQNRIFGC